MTIAFNNLIQDGQDAQYFIHADVVGVDQSAGDEYEFRLQFQDDLNVIENSTAFKSDVAIDANTPNGKLYKYTVQGGDVVLSRPSNVLTTQTVAPGQQNVELVNGNISARQSVRFEKLTVNFTNGGNPIAAGTFQSGFNSLRLMVDGKIVSTFTPDANTTGLVVFE
jgi:hypothetical protein